MWSVALMPVCVLPSGGPPAIPFRTKEKTMKSTMASILKAENAPQPTESWMASQLKKGVLKGPTKTSSETRLLRCSL